MHSRRPVPGGSCVIQERHETYSPTCRPPTPGRDFPTFSGGHQTRPETLGLNDSTWIPPTPHQHLLLGREEVGLRPFVPSVSRFDEGTSPTVLPRGRRPWARSLPDPPDPPYDVGVDSDRGRSQTQTYPSSTPAPRRYLVYRRTCPVAARWSRGDAHLGVCGTVWSLRGVDALTRMDPPFPEAGEGPPPPPLDEDRVPEAHCGSPVLKENVTPGGSGV